MFEVVGDDITKLSDADLRRLVERLTIAELRSCGAPISSVTAGGNQDAADGGLDVRVDCPNAVENLDFVPRLTTGFQVKKPDMAAAAIEKEMRPKKVLRSVIRELAAAAGAYIIVSAKGSTTDSALRNRRAAMRKALGRTRNASKLHVDFYDRNRVANWVNKHPGVAAWVREMVGRPLSGWSGMESWSDVAIDNPYLVDDRACVVDERTTNREPITLLEAVDRMRSELRIPGSCVRLVGLSGLGKTRMVQALFETEVGDEPLDPSCSVYTDYNEHLNPTARDMVRELVARRERAIVVVDNCNPGTHSELARLCSAAESQVSVLTVEYDVADDEPESTSVFRLQPTSPESLKEWLKVRFPDISQVDRDKIVDFSDSNFRVARALAETLGKGETLGSLRNRDLFRRIFHQRHDPDERLLRAAEDISLLYSIDGVKTADGGELATIASISRVDSQELFEALVKMRKRGVVQARGPYRAILPQAIANPLARDAIERIPALVLDRFAASLSPRMLKSLSRRLGYLHESETALKIVERWLSVDGPLGDLFGDSEVGLQVVTNMAPVAPAQVLDRIRRELEGSNSESVVSVQNPNRYMWTRLIKALGYDSSLFESAVELLWQFGSIEPEGFRNNAATNLLEEFFHIYLSGTHAKPEQRLSLIRRFAFSDSVSEQRCALIALEAMLETGNFISFSSFDFGARSRDWGWSPTINQEVWDWFHGAVSLAVELEPRFPELRGILANHVTDLWIYPTCRDVLDHGATAFLTSGPWIEGWHAFRAALRHHGDKMPGDVRLKLLGIIERLKPANLLNKARAVVLGRANGSFDIVDGKDDEGEPIKPWKKAEKMAEAVGGELASAPDVRKQFVAELVVAEGPQRPFQCGVGIATESSDLPGVWDELKGIYLEAESEKRDARVLLGFLFGANRNSPEVVRAILEGLIGSSDLGALLPYFQTAIVIDSEGCERLRRAISASSVKAGNFRVLANGSVNTTPADSLKELLEDIATMPDGIRVALEILHMRMFPGGEKGRADHPALVPLGRKLLVQLNYAEIDRDFDYDLSILFEVCLFGEEGTEAAATVCGKIRDAAGPYLSFDHNLEQSVKSLFQVQPLVALNTFLVPEPRVRARLLVNAEVERGTTIESVDEAALRLWADQDPEARYPAIGQCLNMFSGTQNDESTGISPKFTTMLQHAPDKSAFLGDLWHRVHPGGWSGSLALVLSKRKELLKEFVKTHPEVESWYLANVGHLDQMISEWRQRDSREEESFE